MGNFIQSNKFLRQKFQKIVLYEFGKFKNLHKTHSFTPLNCLGTTRQKTRVSLPQNFPSILDMMFKK